MNVEQFIKLAEAYGGDINRWPEFYQQQATEIIAKNIPEISLVISQERSLDAILASQTFAPAERNLFVSIVDSAPKQKNISFFKFIQQWDMKRWLSFSGVVGTGLAGALVGMFFVSIWTSGSLSSSIDGVTETSGPMAQYVDLGQDWT